MWPRDTSASTTVERRHRPPFGGSDTRIALIGTAQVDGGDLIVVIDGRPWCS